MANPASCAIGTNRDGEFVKSTGTSSWITLDPDKTYAVSHTSLAEDGTTAATGRIVFRNGSAATNAITADVNNWVLFAGFAMPVIIGPGVTTLHFISADSDVVFNIFPIKPNIGHY